MNRDNLYIEYMYIVLKGSVQIGCAHTHTVLIKIILKKKKSTRLNKWNLNYSDHASIKSKNSYSLVESIQRQQNQKDIGVTTSQQMSHFHWISFKLIYMAIHMID